MSSEKSAHLQTESFSAFDIDSDDFSSPVSPHVQDSLDRSMAGLVSFETLHVFQLIILVILTGIICLFGMVANIINIIIFCKQGFQDTMNISLFGLAVSDFFSVATLEWTTICYNPLFMNSNIPWDTTQIQYLTGAWPHLCFGRITCWITTYITAERCLCIALPLKVKHIITAKRTTITVCTFYVVNIVSLIPAYSSAYFDWVYFPGSNSSLISLVVRENMEMVEPVGFVLFAVLGTAAFPAVIVFTAILVVRLRRQSKWRVTSSNVKQETDRTSRRDIKTVNLVVLIACVLIVCYTPSVITGLVVFLVPSFNKSGSNVNLFFVMWTFVALCEAINSSVNVFLYYNMSSKYKKSFHEMFQVCLKTASLISGIEVSNTASRKE